MPVVVDLVLEHSCYFAANGDNFEVVKPSLYVGDGRQIRLWSLSTFGYFDRVDSKPVVDSVAEFRLTAKDNHVAGLCGDFHRALL